MNEQEANATGRQATLAEQRHRVEALAVACSIDEQRLVLELREHEVYVTSVWDFIAFGGAPPKAVPILVAHLSTDHHERIW